MTVVDAPVNPGSFGPVGRPSNERDAVLVLDSFPGRTVPVFLDGRSLASALRGDTEGA